MSVGVIASLLMAACSAGDDDGVGTTSASEDDALVETTAAGEGSEPTEGDAAVDEPLGFDTDRYEIPVPGADDPELDAALAGFSTVGDLIDRGIDAGTWSEIEATRAIVSVIMGELPPEAVPGIDELAHPSIPQVLDRAEALLEDNTVDEAERADLARLTAFFFDTSPSASSADEPEGLRRPQSIRRAPQQSGACGDPVADDPSGYFKAADALKGTSYCRDTRGADVVLYPTTIENKTAPPAFAASADRLFAIIKQAREGYLELAGTEMPPVKFLISARPDTSGTRAEGHVTSRAGSALCIGAIFATSSFLEQSIELDNTMAHELFHCVQGAWTDDISSDFVGEAGASYFAYKLLDECSPADASRVGHLDANTTNGSLLATEYEGWFFWAFLDEHTDLDSQQISQMHQEIADGIPPDDAIRAYVSDFPRALNEFFVRLMGPGLACGGQGTRFTDKIEVTDTGPIELADVEWHGSRYELTYPQQRLYTQIGDGGPMGMAIESQRLAEAGWVVVAPEVRTMCDDDEQVTVVVAGSDPSGPRNVEVLDRQDATCDPCPIGAWNIDLDSMASYFETFDPNGFDVTMTGSWRWEFAGASNGQPGVMSDDENIQITFSGFQGPTATGVGQGEWTADGSTLTVSSYSSSNSASFFGVDASTGQSGQGASLGYTCDGDVMNVEANGATIVLNRITPQRGEPYFR